VVYAKCEEGKRQAYRAIKYVKYGTENSMEGNKE
jgi:hypothetical protein